MAASKSPIKQDINLLLIGKTGHGKSSTGNSILGKQEFITKGGGTSVTEEFQVGVTTRDKRAIKVVDTPGIFDTSKTKTDEKKIDLVTDAISDGLSQSPHGYSALILVLSYAARLTDEEVKAIKLVKLILGEDSIKKHVICVFTYGSNFEEEHGDKDFLVWCNEKKQECYKDLLDECGHRVVLFDNSKRAVPETKISQVEKLISMTESLQKANGYYTLGNYASQEENRELLRQETQIPKLLKEYETRIALIQVDLSKIMRDLDAPSARSSVQNVKGEITYLKGELSQFKHPSFSALKRELDSYLDSTSQLMQTIDKAEEGQRKMNQLQRNIDEKENMSRNDDSDKNQVELLRQIKTMKSELEDIRLQNESTRKNLDQQYTRSQGIDKTICPRGADKPEEKSTVIPILNTLSSIIHVLSPVVCQLIVARMAHK